MRRVRRCGESPCCPRGDPATCRDRNGVPIYLIYCLLGNFATPNVFNNNDLASIRGINGHLLTVQELNSREELARTSRACSQHHQAPKGAETLLRNGRHAPSCGHPPTALSPSRATRIDRALSPGHRPGSLWRCKARPRRLRAGPCIDRSPGRPFGAEMAGGGGSWAWRGPEVPRRGRGRVKRTLPEAAVPGEAAKQSGAPGWARIVTHRAKTLAW